jgi:hypothetical protein
MTGIFMLTLAEGKYLFSQGAALIVTSANSTMEKRMGSEWLVSQRQLII